MSALPPLPALLAWIAENPHNASRREIARAFNLGKAERAELKRLLRQLEAEGKIEGRARARGAGGLPPVAVLEVTGPDAQGDLMARPLKRAGAEGAGATGAGAEGAPILVLPDGKAPGVGARILARLTPTPDEPHSHEARIIKVLARTERRVLGIFRQGAAGQGGRIVPIDKGADLEWQVPPGATEGARDGELVEAEQASPKGRMGLPRARIVARLGDPGAARSVSLIAIHQHGIPDTFPDAVLAEAEAAAPPGPEARTDLRDLPFITIDPADARDRDDAVCALPDDDPANPGGFVVWVAIADVAHFVRPGSALDREARKRGNSTYFPDRVVPMLPERLSADLCSLAPGEDRAVLAVRMRLDAQGNRLGQHFERGLIRSAAALSYAQAQAAADGAPDAATAPLCAPVIAPLYAAYHAARAAREARQPLDLDLPERRIELSPEGQVLSVAFRDRFDAHRLIEEFMILANVAAAEELGRLRRPLLYRVHEEPAPEKIEALREVAAASGFTLAKGQVLQTRHLNRLLDAATGTEFAELINLATLRSMTQAYYAPGNLGHFGLALPRYAHFTSPIRRYADLIVHRALITGHGWGEDGLSPHDIETLEETAEHISAAERRSMMAERDTADRYLAAYLADRVGSEFAGRISGIARFGVFVRLDETGADGLVPMRALGAEYFRHDPESQTLTGSESGRVIGLGQRVLVRLAEATPLTGGLTFELLEIEGRAAPRGGVRGRKGASKGASKGTRAPKPARRRSLRRR